MFCICRITWSYIRVFICQVYSFSNNYLYHIVTNNNHVIRNVLLKRVTFGHFYSKGLVNIFGVVVNVSIMVTKYNHMILL